MSFRPLSTSASRGALSGGFSQENLADWANRAWGDAGRDDGHHIDLQSHKISAECASMLENHSHPSSTVSRALFQSKPFAAERFLLSALGKNSELPLVFKRGESFLFFKAEDVSPHEMILTWKLGSSRGCTMLAVDPRLRKVYLGSGIEKADYHQGFLFQRVMLPFHLFYSNLLMKGIVEGLEQQAVDQASNNR